MMDLHSAQRSPSLFAWIGLALIVSFILSVGCSSPDGREEVPRSAVVDDQVEEARSRLETSEGGRHILAAIDAHGGLRAWYEAPTSSYTWEYANVGADLHFKSFLVADNATRRVYHDLLSVGAYGDPQPVDAQFAWDGENAWIHPAEIESINPRFWATTGYYFEQIPFVLADPGLNFEVVGDERLDGRLHQLVRVTFEEGVGDSPDDTYVVYLDPETHRVQAVRYTVTYGRDPSDDAPRRETLLEYGDYVTVDGLTVPKRFRGHSYSGGTTGEFRNEAWADSISFRRPFDDSRLEAPEGARFVGPPAP